jgi:hypothetical protein
MESSSSGNYRDYGVSKGKDDGHEAPITRTGGGGPAGGAQRDRCREDLTIELEEVARCDYFRTSKAVPGVGTAVRVRDTLVGGRIAVETVKGSVIVGFLPVAYNYIRGCLADGHSYTGKVCDSTLKPIPAVSVDLKAK